MQPSMSGVEQDAALDLRDGEELQRFRRAFEHAAIGMLIAGRDGRFIDANEALRAMLGRTDPQLQRLKIYDIIHPDDSSRSREVIQRALSGESEQIDVELCYLGGGGECRWGRLIAWLDRDNHGQPGTLIAQLQDITAQKQSEVELRQALARYRTLIEQIPASTYISAADDVGHLLYQSPQIRQLLGYTPEEWLVRPDTWHDHIHPDDLERVISSDIRSSNSGDAYCLEYRFIARDGRTVWVRDEGQLVRDSIGQPDCWQGIIVDITRQKEGEERLRLQQALLTAVVETTLDGIAVNSDDGTVLVANRQFMRLWNFPDEELVGTSSAAVHDHCVVQVADQEDAQAGVDDLHERRDATDRKELLMKDGRTLDRFSSPVVGDDGAYYGRVWYYRDSTERSRMERELRASERQLAEAQRLAGLGSWEWDIETGEAHLSDEGCRILGIEPGSVPSAYESLLNLIHPRDRARLRTTIRATLESGMPYQLDFTIIQRDGSERVVNGQGEVMRDEHGRTTGMRGTLLDVTVRRELEAQLARQALLDPLTGLPNRRSLSSRLDEALERSPAESAEVALLFVDLDNFKDVNDQLGHDAGDDVLIEVAARLQRCIREQDMAVRLGGDEFVVLLDGVSDIDSVTLVADRLLATISAPIQTDRSATPCQLTASIGIVMSDATTCDAEELLHASDAAMYSAKARGKARWITGSPLPPG